MFAFYFLSLSSFVASVLNTYVLLKVLRRMK